MLEPEYQPSLICLREMPVERTAKQATLYVPAARLVWRQQMTCHQVSSAARHNTCECVGLP